jgi:hypothetical protein
MVLAGATAKTIFALSRLYGCIFRSVFIRLSRLSLTKVNHQDFNIFEFFLYKL